MNKKYFRNCDYIGYPEKKMYKYINFSDRKRVCLTDVSTFWGDHYGGFVAYKYNLEEINQHKIY